MPAPHPRMHGLTHVPGGSDPIPGLPSATGGNWEDRVRAAGTLTAWWRLGDTFTPGSGASTVTGAAVDSAAYDASSPRSLNYTQATTGGAATPDVLGAPALGGADDGALKFAAASDAYLVQTHGAGAGSSPPWDVTVWGSSGDALRSVSCWIKTPASFSGQRPILGRWNMDVSGSFNVGWILDLNTDTLRFQVMLDFVHTITGPVLAADTWYHVAVTYEPAANTWRLYVNGALSSGLTDSHGFYGEPSSASFRIGGGVYDSGLTSVALYFSGGTVDEVALYNTTLSADAVASLAEGVTIADGYVWTATGGTPSWQPPTVEVDGSRYQEIITGTNLTSTDNGDDTVTIDATGGGGGGPTGAAGGALDGSYPNPGLAASVAGAGLSESADVLAVNVDGSTIEIASDVLRVKADGITASQIAANAVGTSELAATSVGAGSYGDATHVAQFTVDADGRLTAASSVAITAAASVTTVMLATWEGGLPTGTGPGQVWRVPYIDGVDTTFDLERSFLRVETPGAATTTVRIESSPAGGAFTPTTIDTLSIAAAVYEDETVASLGSVSSGDLLRITWVAVGASAAVTFTIELEGSAT